MSDEPGHDNSVVGTGQAEQERISEKLLFRDGLRQSPPGEKQEHADAEQPRIRAHRTGGDDVDEQQPHADDLSETSEIEDCGTQSQK
jgi:hypothetical protein